MQQIVIRHTRAHKRFRDKLGNPVRNLNSVVVGLCSVGSGVAVKPADLAVTWAPKDLKRAEKEGRSFAIQSMMVMACDALDHYLFDIGSVPSPISDAKLRSILMREPQIRNAKASPSAKDIDSLALKIKNNVSNDEYVRTSLKEFAEKFLDVTERPASIRKRLSAIHEHCKSLPAGRGAKFLRPSYFSAIELLLAWRNMLVHDLDAGQLGGGAVSSLRADSEYLAAEHAGIDVEVMINRYTDRAPPSLKEISTLVSILMRFMSGTDQILLADCDIGAFFERCLRYQLSELGGRREKAIADPTGGSRSNGVNNGGSSRTLVERLGFTYEKRVRKSLAICAEHGFLPADPQVKSKDPAIFLDETHTGFLRSWEARPL